MATARRDVVNGTTAADTIDALGGDDTVRGGLGNDLIDGRDGEDELFGGAGNDRLFGGNHADTLDGGSGADQLYGERGDDWLCGGADNDAVDGGSGADVLVGGANVTLIADLVRGQDRLEIAIQNGVDVTFDGVTRASLVIDLKAARLGNLDGYSPGNHTITVFGVTLLESADVTPSGTW